MKEIKIAGYVVKIKEDEHLIANEARLGEYSPFEQQIKLASNMTEQQKSETFIHEVLEAINDIYELNLEHDEQLCKLSVAIHQIIVDNFADFDFSDSSGVSLDDLRKRGVLK